MIALDTNLLVYAHMAESKFHVPITEALRPIIEGAAPWALPWPCVHEFIGVVTNPRIYKPASTLPDAFGFLDALMSAPNIQLLAETPGYFEKLRDIAQACKISGPRIHDARIAALCLHHGVSELWTADRDFAKFPQLRTRNPLEKK